MNAKSQNRQNIQNPEGWDKPWPFADEIELFRIPEEEQETALNIEIQRETRGIFKIGQWLEEGQKISDKKDPPWLSLSDSEKQALVQDNSSISIASHSDLLSLKEPKKIDEDSPLHEDAYGWRPSGSLAIYDYFKRQKPRPGQEQVVAEDLKICLSINMLNQAGIEKLVGDFKMIIGLLMKAGVLDGTGAHGTGKKSDIKAKLRSLAVYRAKKINKGQNFMRFFKGTEYQGTERNQKSRIRTMTETLKGA